MGIDYKILGEHRLIVASMSGLVDVAAVRGIIQQVAADPGFVWDLDRLVFVEQATNMSEIDLSDLFVIREEVIRSYLGGSLPHPSELPVYRIALIVNHLGNEGIIRLFSTVLEHHPAPLMEVQTFETAEAALSWLGHENLSATKLHDMVAPEMHVPRELLVSSS